MAAKLGKHYGSRTLANLIILIIGVLVFGGRGKISSIMGDFGKGITSFRKGLKEGVEDVKDAAEEALDVTPPKSGETTKPKSKSKKAK